MTTQHEIDDRGAHCSRCGRVMQPMAGMLAPWLCGSCHTSVWWESQTEEQKRDCADQFLALSVFGSDILSDAVWVPVANGPHRVELGTPLPEVPWTI